VNKVKEDSHAAGNIEVIINTLGKVPERGVDDLRHVGIASSIGFYVMKPEYQVVKTFNRLVSLVEAFKGKIQLFAVMG